MRGVRVRKLIVRRRIYFLALTPLMRFRPRYYKFWVSLLFVILKSTWVCRHWWVEQKNRVSSTLKKGCGKKLQGWKEKLLSQAGREVLIKAVIQAIPTNTMNCFKLPKGLVRELEGMIHKFWWGYRGEHRKTH